MNRSEFKKDYPTLQFENDEDVVKMLIFYFIELAKKDKERRQHMNWTMLGLTRLSWYGPRPLQVWAYDTVSSISRRVIPKELSSAIPRIMRQSCTHSSRLKSWIDEIQLTDDDRAYLDRSHEISTMESYEEGMYDPLSQHVKHGGMKFPKRKCKNVVQMEFNL
ncbi:hypothetical protein E5676_scaffold21G00220 [Cucumis melo var. makuwa]|uniref:Uncharacterized protein n=1 Tax=Cucumis melo var. makuwa TaxID=1194695 RepID=A0A5D3CZ77_CUCMM|nr:hypothetical protein E5676_scaffold21G00220 [Cucumis melo var. makuwa]